MSTVLCFGDSNTWGFVPGSLDERFPWEVRWPGVLQQLLGEEWRVLEEGLPGRTTVLDSAFAAGRNGREYLVPCLESHRPLDAVAIFLGTNDLQDRYAMTASDIARGIALLAQIARAAASQVLLLGLPRLGAGLPETMLLAREKAAELPRLLGAAAADLGVPVVDLAHVAYSDLDGVHLDPAGHRAVAEAVAAALR